MVASLGKPLDRLLLEHVEPSVDPVRKLGRLAEPADDVRLVDVDDAEVALERRDCQGRGPAPGLVVLPQAGEVEIEELVAVSYLIMAPKKLAAEVESRFSR